MKKAERVSKELLLRLYVDERKPTEAIGAELGMSGRYIRMLLKQFAIPTLDRMDEQIARLRRNAHRFPKGVPSWSAGLTKATHPGVALIAASKIGKPRHDMRGDLHPLWNGGSTSEAMLVRSSDAYVRWRNAVFARDIFTCLDCGCRGGKLHAHHILAFATHPELRLDVGNGITVCIPCHSKRHPNRVNLSNHALSLEKRLSISAALKVYWSDPANRAKHSERIKASMTDARRQQISDCKMGSVPWNKGLKKETTSGLQSTGKKNSARMKGKTGKESNVWKRWHPEG